MDGFLEALAEDHLAVNAAVDLVVDVLDARAGHVVSQAGTQLVGMNGDLRFLGEQDGGRHRGDGDQKERELRFEN